MGRGRRGIMSKFELTIGDKYLITTDPYNYILQEKKINTTKDSKNFGEEYMVPLGFYRDINQVVSKLLDLKIKGTELKDAESLGSWYEEVNNYIYETIQSIQLQLDMLDFKNSGEGVDTNGDK
jgi:hypothetical protein